MINGIFNRHFFIIFVIFLRVIGWVGKNQDAAGLFVGRDHTEAKTFGKLGRRRTIQLSLLTNAFRLSPSPEPGRQEMLSA
jgi:hypothetical protein